MFCPSHLTENHHSTQTNQKKVQLNDAVVSFRPGGILPSLSFLLLFLSLGCRLHCCPHPSRKIMPNLTRVATCHSPLHTRRTNELRWQCGPRRGPYQVLHPVVSFVVSWLLRVPAVVELSAHIGGHSFGCAGWHLPM